MEKKKTIGSQILEHDTKRLALEDDIIEYRKQMEPDILKKLYNTAFAVKDNDLYRNKYFYVVMLTINDKVLRTPRIVMLARRSCPTPVYNQAVWKFDHLTGTLEFLWSIPDSILYNHIIANPEKYINDKECSDTAKFVILMESGDLLKWVKKENKEKRDAVIFTTPQTKEEYA